jgi:hypothetical protein
MTDVGYRERRLEREVDESDGRQSQRQSRTKENGYVADEVLGIGAANILVYFYAWRTWLGQQVKNQSEENAF